MDESIGVLVLAFVLLQVLDAGTTVYGLRQGLSELNGIARWVFDKLGVYGGLVLLKVPITAVVLYIALNGMVGRTFMMLLVVPFVALFLNNLYWIVRSR